MPTATIDTWDEVRERVLSRDRRRCTVARLLGGKCRGSLHVHHIIPRDEGGSDDEDNLATVCASHHPRWESLRRAVLRSRGWKRCPHKPGTHRYDGSRAACERRLNRELLEAA